MDGPEIAGPPVDQGRFRSSKRMGTKESWLQSDLREPVVQQAGIRSFYARALMPLRSTRFKSFRPMLDGSLTPCSQAVTVALLTLR